MGENATAVSAAGTLTHEQVQAEMQRLATDPEHPHHKGFANGWKQAEEYVAGLYKRIPGADAKIAMDVGVPTVSESPEADQAFHNAVAEQIKERGVSLDAARLEGSKLFSGKQGAALLDVLEDNVLMGLSPLAEQQAHVEFARFLSDLSHMRAGASDAPPQADFDAALATGLQEKGIDRLRLGEIEQHLFMGKPEAYKHFKAYLDAMPSRVAAYVRAAEALVMLGKLYQSQS